MSTTTFYPDANSVDGLAGYDNAGNESWATVHDASGNSSDDSTASTGIAYQMLSGVSDWRILKRGIIGFKTTDLSTDVINSAILSLYGSLKIDSYSSDIVIVDTTTVSDTALQNSDGDIGNFGTTEFTDARMTIAAYDAAAYNGFTLNASGLANIDGSGQSKFGLMSGADFDDSEPVWQSAKQDLVGAFASEETGTSKDPKLVVVHNEATISGIVKDQAGTTIDCSTYNVRLNMYPVDNSATAPIQTSLITSADGTWSLDDVEIGTKYIIDFEYVGFYVPLEVYNPIGTEFITAT